MLVLIRRTLGLQHEIRCRHSTLLNHLTGPEREGFCVAGTITTTHVLGADFRLAITATDKNNQKTAHHCQKRACKQICFVRTSLPTCVEESCGQTVLDCHGSKRQRRAFTKLAVSSLHLPTLVDVTDSLRKLLPKIQEKRHIK